MKNILITTTLATTASTLPAHGSRQMDFDSGSQNDTLSELALQNPLEYTPDCYEYLGFDVNSLTDASIYEDFYNFLEDYGLVDESCEEKSYLLAMPVSGLEPPGTGDK